MTPAHDSTAANSELSLDELSKVCGGAAPPDPEVIVVEEPQPKHGWLQNPDE
jgi:hypothetical protein